MNVAEDGPADTAGIEPGMVVLELDGKTTDSNQDFSDSLEGKAYQNVSVLVYDGDETRTFIVKLDNKFNHSEDSSDNGTGYMGVYSRSTRHQQQMLSHPIIEGEGAGGKVQNFFLFISMPFQKLSPFPQEFIEQYEVNGPMSVLPEGAFWVLANICYWIFWLNLMVGLTNALPAVPLDGGYIFNDMADKFVEKYRPRMDAEQREKVVEKITIYFAFGILFLIIWQLVGPYVGALF